MKTTRIIQNEFLGIKRLLSILSILVAFATFTNAQTTVTYAQRIANYYATNNNGGTVGDNSSYQVGMTAHVASPKQVVCWRKFRQDGSAGNSSDRSMQIGDQFVVTVSATRAYGLIGFSLLSSPSTTASYADRENNYALSVYLPGPLYPAGASWAGKWTVKSNAGTTATASFGGNQSPTWKNFTFTMTLMAADRMNVTMTDGTSTSYFFDVQLAKSTPITDYSIFQEDDWDGGGNMGCYWGLGGVGTQHKLTDKSAISLGSSNTSFSVTGVLTNGFAANSTTTSVNNSLTKVGTANVTLSAANTYSGTTQIDGGSLILGINNAIPSGVSGVQSAVIFNGGTLSTGASSAGFSSGTSAYPMGAMTVNATNGTISLAATSSSQNLYFANSSGATWAGNLNITGWAGTTGASGTNGHIYVGNSASGLTASQLARISFSGYTGSHAMILSTGEIVPTAEQNPIFFSSGNFVSPNSWSERSSTPMTALAGKNPTNKTSYYLSTNSNNTGSDYFKFFSDISGSGYYYGPSTNTSENFSTAFSLSTANRAAGVSYYIAGTSGNKYFIKTLGTSSFNTSAVVFDLGASGTVQTIASVNQSPGLSSVYAGYPTTVTATISGAFTGTQVPYLRYSTSSNFTASTVVAMTGSGTTYTATIPSGTNVASTPVYYYVFTSGSGGTNPAADGSDADLFAINYNDNAGANYSYTPIAGSPDVTFSVSAPGSGSSGYVGNTVTITGTNLAGMNTLKVGGSGGTAVTSFTVLNSTTITFSAVEATGTLWLTDGTSIASSAATYTNLGYISDADADWNSASTWLGAVIPSAGSAVTIANAVTLNATATNNPVSVTINSGKSLTLGASGALTINAGGSLTNNGTASLGAAGTVTFAGTATITGASTFNNLTLNGTTTLNNAPTVNGTLIMNTGTTLLTNSPVYGVTGTLNYNLNNGYLAKYNTSLEWPASSSPSSVVLNTNSWVQMTGNRSLTGNLTISGGALQAYGALRTLTMNGTTQTISVSGGSIYGTENGTNNDLQLTIASGSTTTFTGNATASADDEKKFFNINVNSGGTLALSRGILCKFGTFTVGGTLQINNNGYVQSNNTTNSALATSNAAANYSTGGALIYNCGVSYNSTDKEWPTTNSPTNVTIKNSGTTVILNNSKTISGSLSLIAGTLSTGANTLTLNGQIFGSGLIDTGVSGTLAFGGNVEQTLAAENLTSGMLNNLVINAGTKLTTSGSITAANIAINSNVTNGTGTLVDNGTLTNSTASVQQYMTSVRNYYISSPVSNATAPAGYTYFKYDEPGNNTGYIAPATEYWESVSQGGTFETGRGYIALPASVPATITFTGTALNTGSKSINLTRTSGKTKEGFNLIANPYPSHITWSSAIAAAANTLSTIWYRTYNSGYSFQTFNATGGIGVPDGTTGVIPPMQAFWVRTTVDGSTLTFNNSIRSHSVTSNPLKVPAVAATNQQVLRLQVSNAVNIDEAVLYFNPNGSNSFDTFDSPKMTTENTLTPEIYTMVGSEQLVINGMNTIQYDTEIPLGFSTGESNTFTIKAAQFSDFESGTQIVLRDKLLNVEQDLTVAEYTFSSDITSTTSRFSIVFKAPSVATGINTSRNNGLWISTNANNQIMINGAANGESVVAVYNAIGQKLINKNLTENSSVLQTPLQSGVYMVTVTNAGKKITKKIIID